MRNCLCPCPALSDASDTFERTYHVHAYAVRSRARARTYPLVCAALLSSVLHLFVSSFGLRLLMARPRPDTPKCQPRDNDEARTSSPPPPPSPPLHHRRHLFLFFSDEDECERVIAPDFDCDAVGYRAGIKTRFATWDRALS